MHFFMMVTGPGWELYRSFLGVVRSGSLSRAARVLGLTQPTLGRHVATLERALGLVLFTRSPGGLAPTEAGLALVGHAEAMEAAAAALVRAASGAAAEEGGTVRLTASEIMGTEVLPPLLAEFRARHPRITVELALTDATQDLLRRDADLAVRHVRPRQEALLARRIGAVPVGLFTHRRYASVHGLPADLAELAVRHALIGWDRRTDAWSRAAGQALGIDRESFAFRCDSDLGQLAALRAGLGIGGAQYGIAARDPDLVPVLPDRVRFKLEIWLAMHEDLRASPGVRLLFDHLASRLAAYAGGDLTGMG